MCFSMDATHEAHVIPSTDNEHFLIASGFEGADAAPFACFLSVLGVSVELYSTVESEHPNSSRILSHSVACL